MRVTDALRGQKVRCPTCHHTFDSPAESEPAADLPHAPQDLPLDLTLGEPSSPPPVTSRLIGAIELTPSSNEPSSPSQPSYPPEIPSKPPPSLHRERFERDIPDLRRIGPRRDAEPDRGAVVLALGIISLALILVWCTAPVAAILGLAAWIMGQTDLRKMKSGRMDDQNRGMTQAGWICGIIGTVLNGLIILSCGLLIGSMWYSNETRLPNTKPIPAMRPHRPPPPKGFPPPPNNPPGNKF